MTPERLQAIRERAEKSAAAPWYSHYGLNGNLGISNESGRQIVVTSAALFGNDADFIAHARQDIPDLLAYVAELEAKLDARLAELLAYELAAP